MYVIVHQGGALRGAFGAPIMINLVKARSPDLILGVSIGAVNGVAAACGRFSVLRDLWLNIDGKSIMNGVAGFLKPSLFDGGALLSLSPMREKLERHIRLKDLKVPFGAGAVSRRTFEYTTFMSDEMTSDRQLVDAVEASSAITFLMKPVKMIHAGKEEIFCDGGHRHSIPVIPLNLLTKVTEVDIILCNPLEPQVFDGPHDGFVSAISWALHAQSVTTQYADLEFYRNLADRGVKIRIFAPKADLGGMLETDNPTIRRRWALGENAFKDPVSL